MSKKQIYRNVDKRIALDIVCLAKEKGQDGISVDDVLPYVLAETAYLDLSDKDSEKYLTKQHVKACGDILWNKKKNDRFLSYTKESLLEAVSKECIKAYEGDNEYKVSILNDIPLIESVDEETGNIVLNDKLFQAYLTLTENLFDYGDQEYANFELKKKKTNRMISTDDLKLSEEMVSRIASIIELYKKDWPIVQPQEKYKWDSVKAFKAKFDLGSDNLEANIKDSFSTADNLLAGPYYYPLSMLCKFASHFEEETKYALNALFDEDVLLEERVKSFLRKCDEMTEKLVLLGIMKKNSQSMQSTRSISVYLSLMYPDKHYLYKYSLYNDFRHKTYLELPSLYTFSFDLYGYETLCDKLRYLLITDKDLVSLHDESYPDDESDYHLLTQDFLYYCSVYLPTMHPDFQAQ